MCQVLSFCSLRVVVLFLSSLSRTSLSSHAIPAHERPHARGEEGDGNHRPAFILSPARLLSLASKLSLSLSRRTLEMKKEKEPAPDLVGRFV